MPLTLGAISFTMSTGQKRSINQCFKQDTIHTATIPWTFNATTTGAGRYLVCHVNLTIAIYWSMSQTGYDPLFYNPVNFQRHYHWALSRLLCQPDNSDLLINVSNRTQSQLDVSTKTKLLYTVLTNVFEVGILQAKVNRRNYNSYDVIYITWLRQSCYVLQHS